MTCNFVVVFEGFGIFYRFRVFRFRVGFRGLLEKSEGVLPWKVISEDLVQLDPMMKRKETQSVKIEVYPFFAVKPLLCMQIRPNALMNCIKWKTLEHFCTSSTNHKVSMKSNAPHHQCRIVHRGAYSFNLHILRISRPVYLEIDPYNQSKRQSSWHWSAHLQTTHFELITILLDNHKHDIKRTSATLKSP